MRQLSPLLLFLTSMLIFVACDSRKVLFEEHQKFGEDYEWFKNDQRTFEIDVQQNNHPFEFVLALRYASSYPYDRVLLQIIETDPAGNEVRRDVDVVVRNEQGEFIGEKGYDIIDLEYVLDDNKEFPVFGKYSYTFSHTMPEIDPLQMVMEIGLVVREKE